MFVLPATSVVRPTSYFTPQSYEYYPSHSHYSYHGAPRLAAPSYLSQLDFFRRPSVEEFEEREYRRALEVITIHRHRQAEKEAVIRRQQLAEAARRRHSAALAAELEQHRQEQLLAARRSEFIRSQQARARLIAAERQHALSAFLKQLKGAQQVCYVCGVLVVRTILTGSSQICRQPHVVKRRPLADILKQRLATESDADITEVIRNVLSSLESRPVQSEKPKDSDEDATKFIENLLSSIFPGLEFRARPQTAPRTEQDQPSVSDKGKGKARAVASEEPQRPTPTSEHVDETSGDILRRVMELSKGTHAPSSPDEAGPSGSSPSSHPAAQPAVTEREQAQIDRAISLSSIEHARNTLTRLQTGFVLPTELDHHAVSSDDRDEIGSVSSTSSSDLTKLIPYSRINKPVYKYENELNGLLEELDKIDSHGDAEVREKRKEVVKAVEKALEAVERVVGEAIEKKLSFISTATPVAEAPLRGFDVDEDITKEVTPVREPVEVPAVVDGTTVPTPDQVEAADVTSVEVSSRVNEAVLQPDAPFVAEVTISLPSGPTSTRSDVEASTAMIIPTSETKPEPEPASLPSAAKESREIDIDSDNEVLVLDSDAEKSDWSELEGH